MRAVFCFAMSACQNGGADTSDAKATGSSPSKFQPLALAGHWRIVAIDGKVPKGIRQDNGAERGPSISFSAQSYGGTAGCNQMGGLGLADGNRYYTYPGPQTVMMCSGPLMEQEEAWNSIMRSGPLVEPLDDGRMRLSGAGHVLELAERRPLERFDDAKLPDLAGTQWNLGEIDGVAFPRDPRLGTLGRLTFTADGWTASDGCRTAAGSFRQVDGAIVVTAGKAPPPKPACVAQEGRAMQAMSEMLKGSVKYVGGPNGELLMAANGHRVIGELDRAAIARDSPAMPGSWTLVEVDGRSAPPRWTFDFGRSTYRLTTGCKPLEGLYVGAKSRLYTSPLPTIDLGCPGGQGAILNHVGAILRGGATLARSGSDTVIASGDGSLRLRRLGSAVKPETSLISATMSGTYELASISGASLDRTPQPMLLTLRPGSFAATTPCGRVGGITRSTNGKTTWFTDGDTEPAGACDSVLKARHRQLAYAFNREMQTVVAADGTLLIAGDGQWVVGRRRGK